METWNLKDSSVAFIQKHSSRNFLYCKTWQWLLLKSQTFPMFSIFFFWYIWRHIISYFYLPQYWGLNPGTNTYHGSALSLIHIHIILTQRHIKLHWILLNLLCDPGRTWTCPPLAFSSWETWAMRWCQPICPSPYIIITLTLTIFMNISCLYNNMGFPNNFSEPCYHFFIFSMLIRVIFHKFTLTFCFTVFNVSLLVFQMRA